MYFCFADESGTPNEQDFKNRFFIICGLLVKDNNLLKFEEDIAHLALDFGLAKKINLKGATNWHYEYKRFGRLSETSRTKYWEHVYSIFKYHKIGLIASVLDKWGFIKKYKPEVREDILNMTYMHFLKKSDQIVKEMGEFQMIFFDEMDNKKIKKKLRGKHFNWINHKTKFRSIENTYWTLFFSSEQESHLLQMAHICASGIDRLFNKQKSDYFLHMKDSFYKYETEEGNKVTINIFPNVGNEQVIFSCEEFRVSYWDYTERDLRSEEEKEKMKDFIWPPKTQ